ncbi:Serine protease inhibitor ecotin (Eco) (PDB:1SLU) [Commensalibacter communis]|uniref:serine protease inhibitor ecotin n=1 Tax=Commensalibacter communis TaxID=2972786 RepID=UPI0022FF5053|nr:serine protease inhibitor ecotin [Commensalibacter communis]CAI3925446.1 Serine protease inhibitor ecotin (Eco) (PDB:1SLU) [Commensalibacter communis]CAI3929211.1 Serine protease inhibitor ecotin (Eco) (PDB:1SLU) [Commensalibacter communis]CAI3929378.1 Serine protease inhibitor ecotin (Eco) (PDB:1SLU) [Commensalibacter communis]
MPFSKNFSLCKICLSLIGFFSFFLNVTTGYTTDTKDPMSIWPKPEKGFKQIVIQLPHLQDEDLYRVELIPEKTLKADCNHIMINGTIETKPLTGWGYEYYVLSQIGQPASTRMACFPQTTELKQIAIHTNLKFLRYNSKLPLVIYTPKDIHLSYRVWSAGELKNAE